MTVLLVDDSPVMRRYVARTLQMTGLETTIYEAKNGRQGMETALDIVVGNYFHFSRPFSEHSTSRDNRSND